MEIFANLFSGLGLFFIGVRGIGSNMKLMTGRRFRGWVAWATGNVFSSALVGLLAGAVTQSTHAVTFIAVSLVTSGKLRLQRAISLLAWANVGTSLLVFLATLDTHIAALSLLGIVGFSHYFGFNDKDRYRPIIGAMLSLCILFLGLWLIRLGAEPLKSAEWNKLNESISASMQILPFMVGFILTLLLQSSSSLSTIVVTMTSAQLIPLDQAILVIVGSNLGSGFSTFYLAANLSGSARQLAVIQFWVKSLGVVIVLPLLLLETHAGVPMIRMFTAGPENNTTYQIATTYLIMQLISALISSVFSHILLKLAVRWYTPNPIDALSRPHYLYDQAIEEAESALDLVEREQARLVCLLPRLLDELRENEIEGTPYSSRELYEACVQVAAECSHFLDRLMTQPQCHETLERIMNVRSRNESLIHLQEGCLTLTGMLKGELPEPSADSLRYGLVEGLTTVLTIMSDTLEEGTDDFDLLLTLTSDRAAMMENLRSNLIKTENGLSVESQTRLLPATSLFERLIWLANHYIALLERQSGKMRGQSALLAQA